MSAPVNSLFRQVIVSYLHQSIPLLWRGGRHKHFVMHALSNHVKVLDNVTPIDLLVQSVVLSDRVVVSYLHQSIPLLWRGGRRSLTGGCVVSAPVNSLLWRGSRHKHFVMHALSNHVKVLHNVKPFVATATNGGSTFQPPDMRLLNSSCLPGYHLCYRSQARMV